MPVAGPDLNRTITSLEQMQQKMEALVQDYRALGDYESTVWWVTGQCRTGEAYEIVARNFRGLPLTLGGVDYPKLKAAFERIATRLDAHAHTGFQRTVQYAETLAIPTDTLERAFQAIDEGTWDHTPDFRKTMSAYRWRHPQSKRTGPSAPESPKAAQ